MNITYISIYKTSLPVLVSLLMEYLIGFTDTAYLLAKQVLSQLS